MRIERGVIDPKIDRKIRALEKCVARKASARSQATQKVPSYRLFTSWGRGIEIDI
jgi:hypothetical protein